MVGKRATPEPLAVPRVEADHYISSTNIAYLMYAQSSTRVKNALYIYENVGVQVPGLLYKVDIPFKAGKFSTF